MEVKKEEALIDKGATRPVPVSSSELRDLQLPKSSLELAQAPRLAPPPPPVDDDSYGQPQVVGPRVAGPKPPAPVAEQKQTFQQKIEPAFDLKVLDLRRTDSRLVKSLPEESKRVIDEIQRGNKDNLSPFVMVFTAKDNPSRNISTVRVSDDAFGAIPGGLGQIPKTMAAPEVQLAVGHALLLGHGFKAKEFDTPQKFKDCIKKFSESYKFELIEADKGGGRFQYGAVLYSVQDGFPVKFVGPLLADAVLCSPVGKRQHVNGVYDQRTLLSPTVQARGQELGCLVDFKPNISPDKFSEPKVVREQWKDPVVETRDNKYAVSLESSEGTVKINGELKKEGDSWSFLADSDLDAKLWANIADQFVCVEGKDKAPGLFRKNVSAGSFSVELDRVEADRTQTPAGFVYPFVVKDASGSDVVKGNLKFTKATDKEKAKIEFSNNGTDEELFKQVVGSLSASVVGNGKDVQGIGEVAVAPLAFSREVEVGGAKTKCQILPLEFKSGEKSRAGYVFVDEANKKVIGVSSSPIKIEEDSKLASFISEFQIVYGDGGVASLLQNRIDRSGVSYFTSPEIDSPVILETVLPSGLSVVGVNQSDVGYYKGRPAIGFEIISANSKGEISSFPGRFELIPKWEGSIFEKPSRYDLGQMEISNK
jgi:hypothetical protein